MQLYTRIVIDGLRKRHIPLTVIGYQGGRFGLPFFLVSAWIRTLFFQGTQVHFGDGVLVLSAPILRFFRPRLRLSATVFGLDLLYPSAFYQYVLRRALPVIDRVVAISAATADAARARGARTEGLAVIPCGIDREDRGMERVPIRGEKRVDLLLFGRQIKRKGTAWFLEYVLSLLLQSVPVLHVTIAGDGPELPRLRELVSRRGWEHVVEILGVVKEEKKWTLFSEATLFLMPNIPVAGDMEGFGLTCIEAASMGLPVVAARLEGIQDAVIDRETGLFFTPLDATDCVRVLKEALAKKWYPQAIREAQQHNYHSDLMLHRTLEHVCS